MPPRSTDRAPLGRPILVVNLKAYPSALGPAAERLARVLEELSLAHDVAAALAPAAPDLGHLARTVDVPILAQHTDPESAGARTGSIPPESLVAAGVKGSLVNHSEHPLTARQTAATVRRLTDLGLVPIVCAGDVRQSRQLARTMPPYLAVEPPDLIGGHRSVATARPQVVSQTVAAVHAVAPRTAVLCGAGVHDRRDVARALELGAAGVLVASAVALAPSPRRVLAELLAGF